MRSQPSHARADSQSGLVSRGTVERLRSLEGTWAFRTLEIDGQLMPVEGLAYSAAPDRRRSVPDGIARGYLRRIV